MTTPHIVRTKITPPRKSKRVLSRPRITRRLTEALGYPLTLLQAYADLALEGLNQSISMGMNAWEQLDDIMVDALKKAQELSVHEQERLLEVTEKFAQQLREGSERVSKIYTEKSEE